MTEKLETIPKAPKFKVTNGVTINNYKNLFSKSYIDHWSRETFTIDSVLNTNPWAYKIKYLNGEKIINSLYKKELLLSNLQMSYYPEPDIHIIDKVKVVFDLLNYRTKKELDHTTGVNTSDLAAKKVPFL